MNKLYIAFYLGLLSSIIVGVVLYTDNIMRNKKSLASDVTEYRFKTNLEGNPYATAADNLLSGFRPMPKDSMEKYFLYAKAAAIEASTVVMDGCNPFPATVHIRKGEQVGFKNLSEEDIRIQVGKQSISIKPGETASTSVLTWTNENVLRRILPYVCGEPRVTVGYIYITP
ncbi:MAG: hypothetical protein RLZZ67_270 [Candidatus Parcubacteria bacterium]|jgi:hypothetical protein